MQVDRFTMRMSSMLPEHPVRSSSPQAARCVAVTAIAGIANHSVGSLRVSV